MDTQQLDEFARYRQCSMGPTQLVLTHDIFGYLPRTPPASGTDTHLCELAMTLYARVYGHAPPGLSPRCCLALVRRTHDAHAQACALVTDPHQLVVALVVANGCCYDPACVQRLFVQVVTWVWQVTHV
jgi:hypothetical protein